MADSDHSEATRGASKTKFFTEQFHRRKKKMGCEEMMCRELC